MRLNNELTILSKATAHKNLSAAAAHIGLSQPQISRIIAKLEKELSIVLLDRGARRKSGWTPVAFELSELFRRSSQKIEKDIQGLLTQSEQLELRIGTLEGLSYTAKELCHELFESTRIEQIELDVFEISELEQLFLAGDLDLIFTMRTPGKQKYSFIEHLGYQSIAEVKNPGGFKVYSPFEFVQNKPKKSASKNKTLISNSLFIRRNWLDKYGGTGHLPSRLKEHTKDNEEPAYLIGHPLLAPKTWELIQTSLAQSLKAQFKNS